MTALPDVTHADLIDLGDPAFVADPYPRLAQARAMDPLAWHDGLGMYLATSHAAATAVLKHRVLGRIFRPRSVSDDDEWTVFDWLHADSILDSEPPQHTRLRRLVSSAFNRTQITRMGPRIEALTQELLAGCEASLAERGSFDVIGEYAEPLPVLVICELLGAPVADAEILRAWSQAIVAMYEVAPTEAQQQAAQAACREFASYVDALAQDRARHPKDDLLTSLVEARDGSDRLSSRELIATAVLLLNAGHEASVNGFGNGFNSLVSQADQAAVVEAIERPGGVDLIVEEMLRHDSPLHLFERTATTDVTIDGGAGPVTIKEGQKVAALLGAANRDPAVFVDPDTFDPTRDPNPHIAFGLGLHFCLGAPLARLELSISTRELLRRFGPLEIVESVQRDTFVLRGFHSLRVRPVGSISPPD